MISHLMNLFGDGGEKEKVVFMGLVWACMMCGLFYLAMTDKTLWESGQDSNLVRAAPRPRSPVKLRTFPFSQLWKLGVYEITVMVVSLMFCFLAGSQWYTVLTRDYMDDKETYAARFAAWEGNAMQGLPPRLPGDRTMDMIGAAVFTLIASAIFMAGAWPMYKAYRCVVYGREVEGISEGVIHDWTMSIILMPARSITYSYLPLGAESEARERRLWKGLPGESWVENVYPQGTKIKVIYDDADPGYAVVPEFLGLTITPLNAHDKNQ